MIPVLFIHQSAELYGSDKTLLILLSRLDRTKFLPVVVVPFNGPLKAELEKEDIEVVIAPVLKIYRDIFRPKNLLMLMKDIRKGMGIIKGLHKKYGFKVVYSNTLAVLLGMLFARRKNIRHIWHVHEIIVHPRVIAAVFPHLLKRFADAVICNSNATKNNLINRIPSLEKKITVVHNGLEPNPSIAHRGTKETYGFSAGDTVITLVGRISRLKGHKWLLNTFIEHFSNNDSVKLFFVGSPVPGQKYYLEEIEQLISDNNINDRVRIIPFVKDLGPVWESTDIAVMPSTEAESFGLVALEAMLAKKPVIASNMGGLTEIVVNNETGFLAESGNNAQLAQAIARLVDDPALRELFGKAGYQRARETFSTGKYADGISGVLLKVAD